MVRETEKKPLDEKEQEQVYGGAKLRENTNMVTCPHCGACFFIRNNDDQ